RDWSSDVCSSDLAVGLADGADDGGLDVFLAVLAAVVEFAPPAAPRRQVGPQGGVVLRRRLAGLQQPRVAAAHLVAIVAGAGHESVVDVLDVPGGVGDDDALG